MMVISPSNTQVKRVRSLLRRKERDETRLFLAEGTRMVAMALEAGATIDSIVYCRPLLGRYACDVLKRAQQCARTQCLEVTEDVFASISTNHGYQGIAAVVQQRWWSLDSLAPSAGSCWIAASALQCPANVGTILRVGDAAGGTGLILIGNSADPYSPKAVQSSVGAVFTQKIIRATLPEFAESARRSGYTVVGTSPDGSADYRDAVYRPPLILFMGNERAGLSAEQQSLCDVMVKIPMMGRMESLNVAVATGIVLYETLKQRENWIDHGSDRASL